MLPFVWVCVCGFPIQNAFFIICRCFFLHFISRCFRILSLISKHQHLYFTVCVIISIHLNWMQTQDRNETKKKNKKTEENVCARHKLLAHFSPVCHRNSLASISVLMLQWTHPHYIECSSMAAVVADAMRNHWSNRKEKTRL